MLLLKAGCQNNGIYENIDKWFRRYINSKKVKKDTPDE